MIKKINTSNETKNPIDLLIPGIQKCFVHFFTKLSLNCPIMIPCAFFKRIMILGIYEIVVAKIAPFNPNSRI